jgi:hypothetical protein
MFFSLLSRLVLLLHCFCLLDRVYDIGIDTFELNYALFFSLLAFLLGLSLNILFRFRLFLHGLYLHLLNCLLFLGEACLFGEEVHDWLENKHRKWVYIGVFICLGGKLLEILNKCKLIWHWLLYGCWLVLV